MKLVSVIMPYYKKKAFIKKSLESVLSQKYKNLEIIIIYDDSELEDLKYIKKLIYKKPKIKLIINKKNFGVSYSRNLGIKHAKGEYIAFLDCDDYWHKSKIISQLNFMKKNQCEFSFTSYSIIDEKNNIVGKWYAKKKLTYRDLRFTCDIGLSSVLLKKNILKSVQFPKLKTKEDYALWLILIKKNIKMLGMKEFLTFWRDSQNSLSKSTVQKLIDAFRVFAFYEKRGNFYALFSVFIMSLFFLKKIISK